MLKVVDDLGLEPRVYQCADLQSVVFAARRNHPVKLTVLRIEALLVPGPHQLSINDG